MRRTRYPYRIVNVFAEVPFTGKSVAVFTDATGLEGSSMAAIAKELHFPQCVFVLPPGDDRSRPRVRVFTPTMELPRAGLPMIATVFALHLDETVSRPSRALDHPGRYVLDHAEEPVSVACSAPVFTVRHDVPVFGGVYPERETAAALLSLRPDQLGASPIEVAWSDIPYLVVPLKSTQALEDARLRVSIWERTLRSSEVPNVLVFAMRGTNQDIFARLRVFTPAYGVLEEAASESAMGPLVGYVLRHKLAEVPERGALMFHQGVEVDRPSVIHTAHEHREAQLTKLRVGGQCIVMGEGSIYV